VWAYECFLAERTGPRRALDIAGGVGRHAVYLAERGWDVTLNDISEEAIARADSNAHSRGLSIDTRQESALQTLESVRGNTCVDLILVFFYLERAVFTPLVEVLAPGGILLVKTRTQDHARFQEGNAHPEYFLRRSELAAAFPALRSLHYREDGGLAELVATRNG